MPNKFPVRAAPIEGESVKGFWVRVARDNGYIPIRNIFSIINHRYNEQCFSVGEKNHTKANTALAPWLNLTAEHLNTHFKDLQKNDIDQTRAIRRIVSNRPRICVNCLVNDEKYHQHQWQMLHNTHCEKHQTPLIHACPCCHSPLEWNGDLLDGCVKCGFRWESYCPIKVDIIPLYQTMASNYKARHLDNYLRALYQALIYAKSPEKLTSATTQNCLYPLDELPGLFTKAYWLLAHKEEAQKRMKALLAETQTTSVNIPELPLSSLPTMFLPLMTTCPFDNFVPSPISDLSDKQASQLLCITTGELNEIAKSGLIAYSNRKRAFIYRLEDIEQLLTKLKDSADGCEVLGHHDRLCLASLSQISHKYLFNFGETIKLISEEKLTLYKLNDKTGLKQLYVSKSQLIKAFEANLNKQFSRLLSISELTKFFNVQQVKINAIAQLFHWQRVNTSRDNVKYQPSEVNAFYQEYLLLDKWCETKNYTKAKLYKYLLNSTITPFKPLTSIPTTLHLFKKTPQLLNTIRQFEQDWKVYNNRCAPLKVSA